MDDLPTTPERPSRLRRAYEALLALDPAARDAHLSQLDPALRLRLLSMLGKEQDVRSPLDVPLANMMESFGNAQRYIQDLIGSMIGPFRLIALLGEGGSSTVFRAERAIGEATQVVALKLLRFGLHSSDARRRFQREQSILAQFSHPNIARLIEAGVSDSGIPYIAMEYVNGLPITIAADQRKLDVRGRVGYFVKLCRAVEAAHAALVVHRDLKPSNVYVSAEHEVKVLDFGIAKLLQRDEGVGTQTQTHSIAMTPEYAAPEQRAGGPVRTTADVYALGVLLGEILTGRRLREVGVHRASEVARAAGLRPPAGLPAPTELARLLAGDLDAIVATATDDEPARRYRSAGALADDLERYLAGRPVLAHPPTRWYRARKFIARHRGGVAVTALLVPSILASLVFAMWQAHRANREADIAGATRAFLVDVFDEVEPAGPRAAPPTVVDVVEAALGRIDSQTHSERVRLDLRTQLGRVLRNQGQTARAIEVLQRASADGLAQFGADDPMVFDARHHLGSAYVVAGDYDAASALLRELDIVATHQDVARRIDFELFAIDLMGKLGPADDALARSARATALCARTCSDVQQLSLSTARAITLVEYGRDAEAVREYEQALAFARRAHGESHVEVASVLNGLSGAYRRSGRLDEAKRTARQTIAIGDIVLPAAHWRRAIHWNNLGNVHMALHEDAQALAAFERAIAITQQVNGDNDSSLAMDLVNVGVLHNRLGRAQESIATLREAVQRAERGFGASNRRTARIRATEAFNLALNGDTAAARTHMDRAVADLRDAGAAARAHLFDAMRQQARILLLDGDAEATMATAAQALALADELGATIAQSARSAIEIARAEALQRLGDRARARAAYEAILANPAALGSDAFSAANAHFGLGVLMATADCAAAREHLMQGRAAVAHRRYVHAYLKTAQQQLEQALQVSNCR